MTASELAFPFYKFTNFKVVLKLSESWEFSMDQYEVKWITRLNSNMKVFPDLIPAPRRLFGIRHDNLNVPQFPHSQKGQRRFLSQLHEAVVSYRDEYCGNKSTHQSNTL